MLRRISIDVKRGIEKAIPVLVFVFALWTVGTELPSLKDMKFRSLFEAWPLLSFLLLGSAINWGLEGSKWYLLGRDTINASYGASLKGVLAGTTIGMWMPGRVGAWVGKLYYVPTRKRSYALFPLMTSGASQFFVTVFMASLAASIWWGMDLGPGAELPVSGLLGYGFLFSSLFLIGGGAFYFFLHSGRGKSVLDRLGFRSEHLLSFRELSKKLYAKVMGLAFFRYGVFLLQFVVALHFWVSDASLAFLFVSVPIVLFVVSVLPSFVLAKLGVREMVVVSLLAPLFGQEEQLILASFTIWLVNLAFPALIGAAILLFSRPALADNGSE